MSTSPLQSEPIDQGRESRSAIEKNQSIEQHRPAQRGKAVRSPYQVPGTASGKDWLDRIPPKLHGWLLPTSLLILWQATGSLGWVSESLLPAPSSILRSYAHLAASGELWEHLGISALRALLGFLLGSFTGLMLGFFTGLGNIANRLLDPSLQMLRTVPLLALIPLFILWFGIGEFSKVMMISLGTFFPLYVNTYLGVRSVDNKLFEVTSVLGFSRFQKLWRLIIPAALPNIMLGVRLSVSTAWLVLVVAEMMATSSGVGYMIQDARTFSNTDIVFAGILIFALVGSISDLAVRQLEKRWLSWRDTFKG